MAGPSNIDDFYQVFDNGQLVGGFGNFEHDPPTVYYTEPMMFQLPQGIEGVSSASTAELAFRVWMHPNTVLQGDDVGGFHTAPLLGKSGAVAAQHRMRWDELLRAYAVGDIFQIIPHPADGSLLIVAGDVAGKGLKAGMPVALLVGAVRSTAEATTEPLAMLQALNRRLLGRGDAQATCLALRIESDGNVTLANAGHIGPYLNGEAMEVEGSLPLGMMGKPGSALRDSG